MSLSEKIKKFVGVESVPEDGFDDNDVQEEKKVREEKRVQQERPSPSSPRREAPRQERSPLQTEKKISFSGTGSLKLVVISPSSYDDCPKLVDGLKNNKPIIINLEKIETDMAKKIFEFLKGATYALNGNVQKVTNNIFIFAPESVDISSNQDDKGGFDFTQNRNQWK